MAEFPPPLPSTPPNTSGSELTSEQTTSGAGRGQLLTGNMEGYDFEFVSKLDERYKCAICLMVLREPQQTPCGHLYCKICILKWLRGSHNRCPVDNEEISENGLFPDNFLRREIENLVAFCPNSKQGCDVTATVKDMTNHLSKCGLALVPCPNKCSHVLHRKDLDEHVGQQCDRRLVSCADCSFDYPAIELESHRSVCPRVRIRCQHCLDEIRRQDIAEHEERKCPKKIIHCTFRQLGCDGEMERGELQRHLQDSVVYHLNLLCHAVMAVFHHLNLPPLSTSGPPAIVTEMTQTEVMAAMAHVLPSLRPLGVPSGPPPAEAATSSSYFTPPTSLRIPSPSPSPSAPSDQASRPLGPPLPLPLPSPLQGTGEVQEEPMLRYRSDPSQADSADLAPGALAGRWGDSAASFSLPPSTSSTSSGGKSLAEGSGWGSGRWAEQKLVHHAQEMVQLQGKVETVERWLRGKMKLHDQQLAEVEGRLCQGLFFWKIQHYSRHLQDAEGGRSTALHSLPFYTRPTGGYRLCVRANLNGVDSARGSHLSLFIHFMQGDYDDVLDWPFSGRISLSVMDQSERPERRHHVEETLLAQPGLSAFQRPATPRNHKGFGYMEFLPLSALKNSTYVKNDTLIVRVHVLPQHSVGESGHR